MLWFEGPQLGGALPEPLHRDRAWVCNEAEHAALPLMGQVSEGAPALGAAHPGYTPASDATEFVFSQH